MENKRYKKFYRIICALLLMAVASSLIGCGNIHDNTPDNFQKRYGLYLPVEKYENVYCEVAYSFITPPKNNSHNLPYSSVNAWNLYHLEEREDGEFIIDYKNKPAPKSNALNINFGGFDNDELKCFYPINANDKYYSTYVIENLETDHSAPYSKQRIWSIRAIVIIIEDETHILMREFFLKLECPCTHDKDGNEVYEGDSVQFSMYYHRLMTQSYSPA